jgi:hypothetical protein
MVILFRQLDIADRLQLGHSNACSTSHQAATARGAACRADELAAFHGTRIVPAIAETKYCVTPHT